MLTGFAAVTYFYTITVMILTDAVTLKQLSPFFIILLASIFLREKIDFKKVIIFILAFLGVLLGALFFKEIPDLFTIFGASLIIVSGYLNYKLKIE